MTEEINFYSRKTDYGWLSNFERASQIVGEFTYPTNEHFYQAHKALHKDVQKWIREAPSPHLAMKAGRSLRPHEMNPRWDAMKLNIMLLGLRAKFAQNFELQKKLLATGDAVLHEDSPTDMFWGKKGQDWLGKLLMQVREEIRDGRK